MTTDMSKSDKSATVLVVDDDPITRELLSAHLSAAGYPTLLARDGAEALALVHEERPRMVISDWVMPQMDGVQLCRAIRGVSDIPFVYFIMLTSMTEKPRLIEAFDAGVDDFLGKPFDGGELMARLHAGARIIRLEAELARRVDLARRLNTRLSQLNARLRTTASTDELTGLLNRREALTRLQEQWAISTRYGHPLSCAMIDVDGFKQINDTLGHAAGDAVLCDIARGLRSATRVSDLTFRLGGDEFLILLPQTAAPEAQRCIDRCRVAIASIPPTRATAATVTISAGVAHRTSEMSRPEDLLHAADQGLYAAKASGKNAVHPAPMRRAS